MTIHLSEPELQIVHDGLTLRSISSKKGERARRTKSETPSTWHLAGDRATLLRMMRSMKEEQDGREARTSGDIALG